MTYLMHIYRKNKLLVGLLSAGILVVALSTASVLSGNATSAGERLLGQLQKDMSLTPDTRNDVFASVVTRSPSETVQLGATIREGTRFRFESVPVADVPPVQPALMPQSTVYGMGASTFGQLGIDLTGADAETPQLIGVANQWGILVESGAQHALTTDSDGMLWATGDNNLGQLGDGLIFAVTGAFTNLGYPDIADMAAGQSHSLIVTDGGDVFVTGTGTSGQLGNGGTNVTTFTKVMSNAAKVAAYGNNSFVITKNGALFAFGENSNGQLGTGDTATKMTPVSVDPAGVVDVAVGNTHTIYLMDDGAVFAMGDNSFGQYGDGSTTPSLTPVKVLPAGVKQIAAGDGFSLFLMDDGVLLGAGSNDFGQLGTGDKVTQTALTIVDTNVVDMDAGTGHTVYVKNNLTLWGVGKNTNGQLGIGTIIDQLSPVEVAAAGTVASVSASYDNTFYHKRSLSTLVITGLYDIIQGDKVNLECEAHWSDGRVTDVTAEAVWADSSGKATILQNAGVVQAPVDSAGGTLNLTATWLGQQAFYDLNIIEQPMGSALYGHGANTLDQLGLGTATDVLSEVLIDSSKVVAMAGGVNHSIYVREDGSVWAMGDNTYGQLGTGDVNPRTVPTQVMPGGAIEVGAGDFHSLIVMRDGSLWAMGRNNEGQLGDTTNFDRNFPTKIMHSGVRRADGGGGHSVVVKSDGSLWTMGRGLEGQLGNGVFTGANVPFMAVASNVDSIRAGTNHTVFTTQDSGLWGMGDNSVGQLGLGTSPTTQPNPTELVISGVNELAAAGMNTYYISTAGDLYFTGDNTFGQLGNGVTGGLVDTFTLLTGYSNIDVVAAGVDFTIFIDLTGQMYGMGDYNRGQLGLGAKGATNTPITMPHTDVVNGGFGSQHILFTKRAPSQLHVFGLKKVYSGEDAQFKCFLKYDNGDGEDITDTAVWNVDNVNTSIGTTGRLTINLGTDGQQANVSATYNALSDSQLVDIIDYKPNFGDLRGLGRNDSYQLGDSLDATPHLTAITVDTGVVAAASGLNFTMYVKNDGSLWATGDNTSGQLGTGDFNPRTSPAMVVAADVIGVACGASHTLFIKNDGSLWAMGDQSNGKLGNNQSTGTLNVPTLVEDAGVVDVSCGADHSLFVRSDGSLWGMGANFNGQLGLPTNQFNTVTVAEEIIFDGIEKIATGSNHSLYIRFGGLYGMGDNSSGQLGIGDIASIVDYAVEIIPSGISDVAAGGNFSLFVRNDNVLMGMGENTTGQLGQGATSAFESSPLAIENNVKDVSAGIGFSTWTTLANNLRSCGANLYGQIGTGIGSPSIDTPFTTDPGPAYEPTAGGDQSFYLIPALTAIQITGLTSVNENDTALYTASAIWSDSTTVDVTDSAVWSIDTAGTFIANELTAASVLADTAAIITASYSGQTGTYPITVVDVPTVVSLAISGPVNMNENNTAFYTVTATWSDSTSSDVSSLATWSIDTAGTFAGNELTAASVLVDTAAIITADYAGQTDTYPITVVDVPTVVSITVTGPTTVNESDTALYTATANWSDASTSDVSGLATWSIGAAGTFTGNQLTTSAVTSDTVTTITAVYGGQTGTQLVTIADVPTLVSLSISGPLTVDESSSAIFTATATWSDASTTDVSGLTTWSINTGGSFSGNTLLTSAVATDTAALITADYGGQTDTFAITVVDLSATIVSIAISGPTAVNESDSAVYSAIATWSDSTTSDISAAASWSINTGGSFALNTLNTAAVVGDTAAIVTANYSGQSDTYAITIIDSVPTVTALTISGPTTVSEQGSTAFTVTATWSNASTSDVSGLATWSVDTGGSFSNNVLSTIDVAGNTPAIITATYSGQTDTYAITILDIPVTLTGITVTGPTTVFEGSTAAYTATATWSDASTSDVSGLATWAIDTGGTFINNVVSAASVAADTTAVITATYGGQSNTLTITVADIVVSSIAIIGPSSIAENDAATFSCIATKTDLSTENVTSFTTFSISSGGTFTGNSLTTDPVSADVAATVTATYTGFTSTKAVTIFNVPGVMTGIRIIGPDTVNENSSGNFRCIADFSDGVTLDVTNATTWSQSSQYATIGANSGNFVAAQVIGDWPSVISASHSGFSANAVTRIIDLDPMTMIYVNKVASGVNNGTSWANAFKELRDAFPKAGPGTEIWVASGVYTPDSGFNRSRTFALTNNMKFYGGFSGVETAVGQRNSSVNVTILSGDIGRSGDIFDNAFHVVVGAEGAIIDGFTIRDGRAYFTPPPSASADSPDTEGVLPSEAATDPLEERAPAFVPAYFNANDVGGGIINDSVTVTITNCKFINNTSLYGGGAIYNQANTTIIEDCTFDNNRTDKWGGAIFNTGNATPSITRCNFTNNRSNVSGGVMMNSAGASPIVSYCQFRQNTAGRDGGVSINNWSNVSFTNCVFWANSAFEHAGAIINNDSNPVFTFCTFAKNQATVSGGAFESNSSSVTLKNTIVWGNMAGQKQAFNPRWSTSLILDNCVIDDPAITGNLIYYTDPLLTSIQTGDLTLQLGSPAIDNGVAVAGVTDDVAGLTRDASPDIGAYEFSGGAIPPDDDDGGGGGGGGTTGTTTGGSSGGGCTLGLATPGSLLPLLAVMAGLLGLRRRKD